MWRHKKFVEFRRGVAKSVHEGVRRWLHHVLQEDPDHHQVRTGPQILSTGLAAVSHMLRKLSVEASLRTSEWLTACWVFRWAGGQWTADQVGRERGDDHGRATEHGYLQCAAKSGPGHQYPILGILRSGHPGQKKLCQSSKILAQVFPDWRVWQFFPCSTLLDVIYSCFDDVHIVYPCFDINFWQKHGSQETWLKLAMNVILKNVTFKSKCQYKTLLDTIAIKYPCYRRIPFSLSMTMTWSCST